MSVLVPAAGEFPPFPKSWYLFGLSRELRRGPVSKNALGRRLVAFRTKSGRVAILDARCSHLGADLGRGTVCGEVIRCPYHHWEYGADGHCCHIPAQQEIPASARQQTYPVVERHGLIFYFNGREPLFPLPFFPDCRVEDFACSRLFGTELGCSWYMIGANAFDLQHFRAAHDRRLCADPQVDSPHPFARRATGTFEVASDSLQDRLTRRFAGPQVTLSITDWCGNLMFATAKFRRTTSYGMVATDPLSGGRSLVRVAIFLSRSASRLGRMLLDPLRLEIRRYFIKKFLSADAPLLDGARYNPAGLIDADRDMGEYFCWLAAAARGEPNELHLRSKAVHKPVLQDSLVNTSVS